MQPRTLKFKVVLYLSIALSVAMLLFTGLVAWFLYTEILGKVSDHVTQLSEVITKSTRFAMLQNQPAYVARIIHDVANQEKIDRIRILSRDGKIIHSTYAAEIGQWVDRNAEACSHCHQSEQPLEQMPKGKRTWTFKGQDGRSLLGSMEVIRNEPSCYNAACHQHSKETSVLGVLDINYSLEEFDRKLRASTLGIAGVSLAFIVIASLSVGFFVHRLVYLPLRDLESGLLAMNRTVGYTASIGAQMILRGDIRKRGLLSPLTDIPTNTFFTELRQRGIRVQREEGDW